MVGREIELVRRQRTRRDAGDAVLELRDVVTRDIDGRDVLRGISLDVRGGEILGIAGVAGNGQRDLADSIAGLRPVAAGSITLDGEVLPSGDPRAAIARGIAYVPEDRTGVGLAPGLAVADNLILKSFARAPFSRGPFLRRGQITAHALRLLERFAVKGTADTPVGLLSGGNAQKVLLARELSSSPRVLIVAAPTRGLDVAATDAVRTLLVATADAGTAVMMISEDLDELLDLADRIAVMCEGTITGVVDPSTEVEAIGLLMMGQTGEVRA
jgi:simple sugar transport system ATP-binding protein